MSTCILTIILLFIPLLSYGQCVFDRARTVATGGISGITEMTYGSDGRLYVLGSLNGTVVLDGMPMTSQGSNSPFLACFSNDLQLQWSSYTIGAFGAGIAMDRHNSVYMTGTLERRTVFGTDTLLPTGDRDIFLTKYDSSGTILWAQQAGGRGYDASNGIAANSSGALYITGRYSDIAFFGTNKLIAATDTSYNIFLARYDSSGTCLWAVTSSNGPISTNAIACDRSGNIYVTGYFRWAAMFGDTVITAITGYSNVYVAKYSPSGEFLWVMQPDGPAIGEAHDIAVDQQGNVYVTGQAQGQQIYGNDTLKVQSVDIFLAKLDSNGKPLWARHGGSIKGPDFGFAVNVDSQGRVYCAGPVNVGLPISPAYFGEDSIAAQNGEDVKVVVATFDPDGTLLCLQGGRQIPSGGSSAEAVAVNHNGNVVIGGSFERQVRFNDIELRDDDGSYTAFLARMSTGTTGAVPATQPAATSTLLFPNPTTGRLRLALSSLSPAERTITVTSMDGHVVYHSVHSPAAADFAEIDLSGCVSGIYAVEVVAGSSIIHEKVVIVKR